MSPQLRQINVSYIDKEDRLLLRVSTSVDSEYRLWCTRRFTKLLLDRFDDLFQQEVAVTVPAPPQARREVAQMQHNLAVSEEAFSKTYEAQPTEYPLGESGLLVTTIKYNKLSAGGLQLQFTDGGDKGMALNLTDALQHQLYELFLRAAEKAGWIVGGKTGTKAPTADAVVH
ncbi:MAG: hypothetical protein O7F73_15190 [Gammaproteobacteria bacterium]|nr:hypothetical protein [Gammaproteobacteria bacterium]